MIYVTFPLMQDKKLILNMLSEINLANLNTLNAILQYEYLNKKITLSKNPRTNLQIFIEKCAPEYQINKEEINSILEIIVLEKKHKKSPMEFVRNKKIIIMSENLQTETITIDKMKKFLETGKSILSKARVKISAFS